MALDREDVDAPEKIRRICLTFPDASEAELQGRPLSRVGRRRFAIFSGSGLPRRPRWDRSGRSLHFVTDPAERDALQQDERFVASPHHGNRGSLSLGIGGDLDWVEVAELLDAAHRQVAPRHSVGG